MELHVRRKWGWADWFVVGLRFMGFLLSVIYIYSYAPDDHRGLVISLALISYSVPQLFYLPEHIRPRWFITTELLLSAGYTLYIISFISDEVNAVSYFYMPVFVVSYLSSKKVIYWVAPLCILVFPFALKIIGDYDFLYVSNQISNLILFCAFGFSFGVFLRQKHKLAESIISIEEKNKELEHYIYQVERITLLEERNRMSRELHDTVGHSLTAVIVAMEAVQTLMDRNPETAKKRLGELIVYSRKTLEQIRQTVHDMAMNELKWPLDELIRKTAEDFSHQTGTAVILEIEEVPYATTEAIKLVYLRCLQESLTNAKKHGHATEIKVSLSILNERIRLTVEDNGKGFKNTKDGYGIQGMKERINALRGTFHIRSEAGMGTIVLIEIPMGG
ncbi:sensor histidine kinase [Bacillus marasmi]|uniref:sensor histidine kinase n=1 Tax=Bacillus marasmi TaxID=1926279 RepID=UPI0011CB4335|nr:sensor histidine kinase [Bacillus marasmi]